MKMHWAEQFFSVLQVLHQIICLCSLVAPAIILTPRHWRHLWPSLNGLCALEMWVNILKYKFIDWELLKGSYLISGECQNYENSIQRNLWGKRKELVPSKALLIWIPKWALGSNNDVLEFPVRHFFFFLMRTACPAASPTLYDMFLICLMRNKHQSLELSQTLLERTLSDCLTWKHTFIPNMGWLDYLGTALCQTLHIKWILV